MVASVVIGGLGFSACGGEPGLGAEDPPRPERTKPPTQFAQRIAWLGSLYADRSFHSVDRRHRPLVVVNYGEPRPPDREAVMSGTSR